MIYNSRNSFGLLAVRLSENGCKIYNSRNSFGLLAFVGVDAGTCGISTIVEIHLAY